MSVGYPLKKGQVAEKLREAVISLDVVPFQLVGRPHSKDPPELWVLKCERVDFT
jgi:hypothetical protein